MTGCDPQKGPKTSGADLMPLQTDALASARDDKTLRETNSNEPLITPDAEGDETSLLATETIDPEADGTAVTVVIRPQKRDSDIETSQEISDDHTIAFSPSKVVTEPPDETVIATFKRTLHPDMLIEMTALEVKTKIGPADFIRHEGIVITWQYRMPDCVIDLFIPFDKATPREVITNALTDNMQISGAYMRSSIHNTPLKETDCLTAFSERRQPTN